MRFVLVGALNTALGLTLFPSLLWIFPYLHENYMIGLIISQIICVIFAFSMYKFTVFKTHSNIFREFLYFSSFYYSIFGINLFALPILVRGVGLSPIPAQFGFSLFTIVGSYFWHSRITFRSSDKT
jgi:putative flippase GtrA